jgi:hypothetical protein
VVENLSYDNILNRIIGFVVIREMHWIYIETECFFINLKQN